MKSNRITYSKLVNYLTKQPYLVWNSLDTDDEEHNEDFDDDFDFDDFVDSDMETTSIAQVQAKMFGPVEKKFIEKMLKKGNSIQITGKDVHERYVRTVEAIIDHEVDVILNATFILEIDGHEIVANISKFNQKTGKISNLKLSTSTKLKDLIKFYFDYSVFNKWQELFNIHLFNKKYGTSHEEKPPRIVIDEASIFVIATKKYKKGEVDFFESFKINSNKSGRSDSEAVKAWDFDTAQRKKTGNADSKKGKKDEIFEIFEFISGDEDDDIRQVKEDWPGFEDIEFYIKAIIDAKDTKKYPLTKPGEADNQYFAAEKEFKQVLERTGSPFSGWSNKVIPKDFMIENNDLDFAEQLLNYTDKLSSMAKFIEYQDKSYHIEINTLPLIYMNLIKRIENGINVWYDFEGFSLSVCPLEGMQPFQQIVPQVSIITTYGLKSTSNNDNFTNEDVVLDPLHITNEYFFTIINKIYDEKATNYIVFNKGYENARLKEMVANLRHMKHPDAAVCASMVDIIIDRTIDLAEYFTASKDKMPQIIIPSLKGMYSIKKIEKYITEHHKDLLQMEFSNVEYKTLEVRNGAMAMDILNNRALGILGDKVWKDSVQDLKRYCENDVKSMITVYYLIKKLYDLEMAKQK